MIRHMHAPHTAGFLCFLFFHLLLDPLSKPPFGRAFAAASGEALPNGHRQNGLRQEAGKSPAKPGDSVPPHARSQKYWLIPARARHFPSLSPACSPPRRRAPTAASLRRPVGLELRPAGFSMLHSVGLELRPTAGFSLLRSAPPPTSPCSTPPVSSSAPPASCYARERERDGWREWVPVRSEAVRIRRRKEGRRKEKEKKERKMKRKKKKEKKYKGILDISHLLYTRRNRFAKRFRTK